MNITRLPFSAFPMLSKFDIAYAEQTNIFKEFYAYPVDIQAFKKVIEDKSKSEIDRKLLVSVLKKQYATFDREGVDIKKIENLLDTKTFTVTTAHQPS